MRVARAARSRSQSPRLSTGDATAAAAGLPPLDLGAVGDGGTRSAGVMPRSGLSTPRSARGDSTGSGRIKGMLGRRRAPLGSIDANALTAASPGTNAVRPLKPAVLGSLAHGPAGQARQPPLEGKDASQAPALEDARRQRSLAAAAVASADARLTAGGHSRESRRASPVKAAAAAALRRHEDADERMASQVTKLQLDRLKNSSAHGSVSPRPQTDRSEASSLASVHSSEPSPHASASTTPRAMTPRSSDYTPRSGRSQMTQQQQQAKEAAPRPRARPRSARSQSRCQHRSSSEDAGSTNNSPVAPGGGPSPASLRRQLSEAQRELEARERVMGEMAQQLQTMKSEHQAEMTKQRDHAFSQQKLAEAEGATADRLRQELRGASVERQALRDSLEASEQAFSECAELLSERVRAAEEESAELSEQLQEISAARTASEHEQALVPVEGSPAMRALATSPAQKEVTAMKFDLGAAKSEARVVRAELLAAQEDADAMRSALMAVRERLRAAEATRAQAAESETSANADAAAARAETAQLRSQLDTTKQEASFLSARLEAAEKALLEGSEARSKLKAETSELRAAAARATSAAAAAATAAAQAASVTPTHMRAEATVVQDTQALKATVHTATQGTDTDGLDGAAWPPVDPAVLLELQKRVDDAEDDAMSMSGAVKEFQGTAERYKGMVEAVRSAASKKLHALAAKLREEAAVKERLTDAVRAAEENETALRRSAAEASRRETELLQQADHLSSELASTQQEIADASQKARASQAEISSLREALVLAKADAETHKGMADTLQSALADAEARNLESKMETTAAHAAATESKQRALAEAAEARAEADALRARLSMAGNAIASGESATVAKLLERVESLEAARLEVPSLQIKQQIQQPRERRTAFENASAAVRRGDSLRDARAALGAEEADAIGRLAMLRGQVAALESSLSQAPPNAAGAPRLREQLRIAIPASPSHGKPPLYVSPRGRSPRAKAFQRRCRSRSPTPPREGMPGRGRPVSSRLRRSMSAPAAGREGASGTAATSAPADSTKPHARAPALRRHASSTPSPRAASRRLSIEGTGRPRRSSSKANGSEKSAGKSEQRREQVEATGTPLQEAGEAETSPSARKRQRRKEEAIKQAEPQAQPRQESAPKAALASAAWTRPASLQLPLPGTWQATQQMSLDFGQRMHGMLVPPVVFAPSPHFHSAPQLGHYSHSASTSQLAQSTDSSLSVPADFEAAERAIEAAIERRRQRKLARAERKRRARARRGDVEDMLAHGTGADSAKGASTSPQSVLAGDRAGAKPSSLVWFQ